MFKYFAKHPFEFDYKKKDPEEFQNRLRALQLCIEHYYMTNPDSSLIGTDIKRPDINMTCSTSLQAVKDFINTTGARYENVYSPITPWMVDLIKNTEI